MLRFFLSVLLLLTFILNFKASTIDSLEQALNRPEDTAKVKILVRLAHLYSESAVETAFIKADQAFSLSKKLKYVNGEVGALEAMGYVYLMRDESAKALGKYREAMSIANDNSLTDSIYNIYNNLGDVYSYNGVHDTSNQYYNEALQMAHKLGKKGYEIMPLISIASSYYYQSKMDKALEYFLNAMKIAEELDKKPAIAQCLVNIGNIYYQQEEYTNALRFYEEALSINEQIKNKEEIALCFNNIGNIRRKNKDYDRALDFYLKALQIKEELKDKGGIENTLGNIGNVYLLKKDYDNSIEFYSRALKLSTEEGNKGGIAKSTINIGNLYALKNENDKALDYLVKGLAIAAAIGEKKYLQTGYEDLADVYAKKGEYKLAFENHKLFSEVKDSLLNEQKSKNIAELQTKYETEKKENQIKLQQSELGKQAIIRNAFIAGCVLLLLIVFLAYNRYRIKKKGNELLTAINAELDVLSLVAREAHNGVMICNGDGTILFANHGIYRMLGYTLEDIKTVFGIRLQDFSHNPAITESIKEMMDKKHPVYYESLNTTREGKKLWVATTLTPIVKEHGEIDKIVVIDVDIHDNKLKSLKIEDQSIEIQKSINYARRIQEALLPDIEDITADLPDSFVLFKPKDVVSGDFYWFKEWNNSYVIAAIDCTGHGVPGAFMSVMAQNILSQMVSISVINRPGYILENLHETVRYSLKQHKTDSNSRDGMDVAMCKISKDKKTLEYAGAMRPLYHVRNGVLTEIKGDKHAIGGHQSEERRKFTTHTVPLEKGDCIYIFSDGYADQFGGPEGKKFMTKRMKDVLVSVSNRPAAEQKEFMNKTVEEWRGGLEQIDDILLVGIRF